MSDNSSDYELPNTMKPVQSAGAKNKNSFYEQGRIEVVHSKGDESIPDKIGKGDDAKNSVVWHVITYSLTIYSCIVAALLVIDVVNNGGSSSLTIVKDSWAIFTPIITLTLGYMFGKKEDDTTTPKDK